MSFINDMKIGKKLIAGFIIVLVIMAIIASYAYTSANESATRSKEMYNDRLMPIAEMGSVSADFQQLRAELYRYIYIPSSRTAGVTTIDTLKSNIRTEMDGYRAMSLTTQERADLELFDTNYTEFLAEYDNTLKAAGNNDQKAVDAALAAGSPLITARTNTVAAYKDIIKINTDVAARLNKESSAAAAQATTYLAILSIAGILIGLGVALYLTKIITGPIDQLASNLKELRKGHLSVRLNLNQKDEIGDMAKTMDSYAEGLQKWIIGTMKKIAEGDLSTDLKPFDAQDEIVPAINTTTQSLRALITEANMLSKAAVEGQLSTRGKLSRA
jgi:methyl-accepting chemotaxis protein